MISPKRIKFSIHKVNRERPIIWWGFESLNFVVN